VVGEGLCGGAEAPPFQDPPASAAQAIFVHGGEPKNHEVFALDDSSWTEDDSELVEDDVAKDSSASC
jgi:hypothetical protein